MQFNSIVISRHSACGSSLILKTVIQEWELRNGYGMKSEMSSKYSLWEYLKSGLRFFEWIFILTVLSANEKFSTYSDQQRPQVVPIDTSVGHKKFGMGQAYETYSRFTWGHHRFSVVIVLRKQPCVGMENSQHDLGLIWGRRGCGGWWGGIVSP